MRFYLKADLRYQLETLKVKTTLDLEYERDGVGNIEAIIDHLDPSRTQGFGYDDLDRLTRGEGICGLISDTYDDVGNCQPRSVLSLLQRNKMSPEQRF